MKLCRFTHPEFGHPRYGLIEEDGIVSPLIENEPLETLMNKRAKPRLDDSLPLDEVRLLAPVVPSKIVCVGRNYRDHAAELGNAMPDEPLLFLKPPSSIIAHEDAIELPSMSERVEHEGELGIIIGRRARRLATRDNPLAYVLGCTCVNDVTARDIQRKEVQFTRAKSFDTFCPIGPAVVIGLDPLNLRVQTRVNQHTRQNARTSTMAFPVDYLIRYISQVMTLEPGDLIATGTPAGVGSLVAGDTVEIEVEGVGLLRNYVRAQASESTSEQVNSKAKVKR